MAGPGQNIIANAINANRAAVEERDRLKKQQAMQEQQMAEQTRQFNMSQAQQESQFARSLKADQDMSQQQMAQQNSQFQQSLAEESRHNKLVESSQASQDARANFKFEAEIRAIADEKVDVMVSGLMDLYRQQEQAVAQYNAVLHEKQKLYKGKEKAMQALNPTSPSGISSSAAMEDPDVKRAKAKIEQLQGMFDQYQSGISQFSWLIPYSSNPDAIGVLQYETSPWERMNMTPEEEAASSKEVLQTMNMMREQQQHFNDQQTKHQMELEAWGAGQKAKAVLPFEMALKGNTAQGNPLGDYMGNYSSNLQQFIKSVEAQAKAVAGVNDKGKLMNSPDVDPKTVAAYYVGATEADILKDQSMVNHIMGQIRDNQSNPKFFTKELPKLIEIAMSGSGASSFTQLSATQPNPIAMQISNLSSLYKGLTNRGDIKDINEKLNFYWAAPVDENTPAFTPAISGE